MAEPLLDVTDLSVRFDTDDGPVHAVDKLSFTLGRGEVLGIVGESGCGKSVTCMSLLRLLPETAVISGRAVFDGTDLLALSPRALRAIRGRDISFVFQEPMTSLNPVLKVGRQVGEVLTKHLGASRREARARTIELLQLVRIPAPERRLDEYPHQLSGGMRQRVMIAMALACDPKVLIADEPTTALDVTIQAGVLDLMRDMRERLGTAIVLITHNLGVVADIADRVLVMYAGRKAEEAPVARPLRGAAAPVHDRPAGRDPTAVRRRRRRRRAPAPAGDPRPGSVAARAADDVRVRRPLSAGRRALALERAGAPLGAPGPSRRLLPPGAETGRPRTSSAIPLRSRSATSSSSSASAAGSQAADRSCTRSTTSRSCCSTASCSGSSASRAAASRRSRTASCD